MKVDKVFTQDLQESLNKIEYEKRTSVIKNPDGSTVFEMNEVIVPKHWSQVATDIIAQKYFRKAGVPKFLKKIREEGVPEWLCKSAFDTSKAENPADEKNFSYENDSRQVFHRLAGCWTYWGWKYKYYNSEEDAFNFYNELYYMLAMQYAAPNSPQWFNTGLNWAYGITGPSQGHYYVDPDTGKLTASEDAYSHCQPHACFIQSINDDLVNEGGIMDLWVREARLFKYGSGTGSNFSNIRGAGEFLRAIKSGGTTRRAAKMITLDLDHPDIEEYINWKVVEEEKVAALVAGSKLLNLHLNKILKACFTGHPEDDNTDKKKNKQLAQAILEARKVFIPENYIERIIQLAKLGYKEIYIPTYNTDWNSEAYMTVSGQNSNNSIRATNDFMKAVQMDDNWNLYWRVELKKAKEENRKPRPSKILKSRKLWDDIAYSAWACADPGIQYHTTINEWHTCPKGGEIKASNPCSEYMFLDDTACNLASLNLMRFYNADREAFEIQNFRHASRLWTMVLEISVLMAQFPSKNIAQKSYDYRTLGLGYANLGAMLMVMGIPYDSPEALAITGAITSTMHMKSYTTSAEMAKELGTFAKYDENKENMLRVIRKHRKASYNVNKKEYEGLSIYPMGISKKY
ncbi:MAG: vitamin B12-dependent ribonucleotide reductase, partial [Ignavibacteriae bacterium]|nr:vitamin B12-dependent ribonucleotide reductase [Ignavibacteriota bacterium]